MSHQTTMSTARQMLVAVLLAIVAALCALSSPAQAAQIESFSAGLTSYQAGGHPDSFVRFRLATELAPGQPGVDGRQVITGGPAKDIALTLPAGAYANPESLLKCTQGQLSVLRCPPGSQVGYMDLTILFPTSIATTPQALFNMAPDRGELARFGIRAVNGAVNAFITVKLTAAGGYRLVAISPNTFDGDPLVGADIEIWGSPNSAAHDPKRGCFGANIVGCGYIDLPDQARPFFTAPAECGVDGFATLKINTYTHPGEYAVANSVPQQVTGCDKLPFAPSATIQPSTSAPDAPTGLGVDLALPQRLDDPNGIEAPPLKGVRVTLPAGLTINPASAGGLQACSDAQLGLGDDDPATCPPAAKIGTVTARTPVLDDPIDGAVYLRPQASDDPESGDMFRLALVLESAERGLRVKLAGSATADKDTGRLVATFDDNPQLPVSDIAVTLKDGPRAPLATPSTCGSTTANATLTSWAGQTASLDDALAIDCTPGLGGFAPVFSAGAVSPVGGAFSPFALSIAKPDGNADVNGLSLVLPTGLLASLKGNLGTQVGTVKAFAGPGADPFMLPGKVFLEGRYDDAPFSLRVVVPAKAGPFDLGDVTVRQKIYVDPITAQVTVVSDPIPTIVKGVPARLQRLEVSVDKPGFMINPTSCAAKAIGGTLGAAGGRSAPIDVRFQVGDCSALALKPKLALTLSGKGQTTDGKHPAVTANLTQPFGAQANLKKVRVALPLSLALDPDNANGLCEFVDGSKVEPTCPKASIVGSVTATTPILDEPLSGPVYFVKNIRKDPKSGREIRTLPKLVIPLVGQNGVKLTLTGTSDVQDDQLVTTFDNIPDAPVSSFKLSIIGGKGGILTVSGTDICKSTQIADQQVDGQNNKAADADVFIQTPSCPLKVLSKKVGKTSVTVKVGGLGAGKVTVTGRGIKKATKTVAKSTVATITARRTRGKPGKVTVSFDPTGPAKARKTTK